MKPQATAALGPCPLRLALLLPGNVFGRTVGSRQGRGRCPTGLPGAGRDADVKPGADVTLRARSHLSPASEPSADRGCGGEAREARREGCSQLKISPWHPRWFVLPAEQRPEGHRTGAPAGSGRGWRGRGPGGGQWWPRCRRVRITHTGQRGTVGKDVLPAGDPRWSQLIPAGP